MDNPRYKYLEELDCKTYKIPNRITEHFDEFVGILYEHKQACPFAYELSKIYQERNNETVRLHMEWVLDMVNLAYQEGIEEAQKQIAGTVPIETILK